MFFRPPKKSGLNREKLAMLGYDISAKISDKPTKMEICPKGTEPWRWKERAWSGSRGRNSRVYILRRKGNERKAPSAQKGIRQRRNKFKIYINQLTYLFHNIALLEGWKRLSKEQRHMWVYLALTWKGRCGFNCIYGTEIKELLLP